MNHLRDNTKLVAVLSDDERIKHIKEERWGGYTRAREVIAKMNELMHYPKTHRMPNLLLVAPTNNGKTIILQKFFDLYKEKVTPESKERKMRVVYIQAPPKPVEKLFYYNILEAVGSPYSMYDQVPKLHTQTTAILKTVETKILIIDEIHHILAGSLLNQRVFLNMIKYIANELQIVIVGAGIRDALSVIATDQQLANRFEPAILPLWKLDDECRRLLRSFESLIPLRKPSNLFRDRIATKILSMSDGTIGEIASILKKSAIYAIEKGKEYIDVEVLGKINYVSPSERQKQYESWSI